MKFPTLLFEMKSLPEMPVAPREESEIEVSLLIPAKNSAHALENTVQESHAFLTQFFPSSFEIILVPNPSPEDAEDRSARVAADLATRFERVRVVPHVAPRGKGAALRTGFWASRGKKIFFTDADLPYDLLFFRDAAAKLEQGYDLVTGNRRLPNSHFDIPVSLLKIAYGRHRLGLWFNHIVRRLFPIRTTDTQAGIKAMTRRLAIRSFQIQTCPGFFFDLEIFLTAFGQGWATTELPVTLHLNSEKSTVRILRESVLAGFWLGRIFWQNLRRRYGATRKKASDLLRLYPKTDLGTRFFLNARWRLTPYSAMASKLPPKGKILDMGCGHGLFAAAAALDRPERQVVGIDHDENRIQLAREVAKKLPNLTVAQGTMKNPPEGPYHGIAMIDVMHYFDPETQKEILRQAFEDLSRGGKLIVREVDPNGGLASKWNRLYERIATGIGFTRADQNGLYFRSRPEWEDLIREQGFEVSSEHCSSFLFADILYVCERTS